MNVLTIPLLLVAAIATAVPLSLAGVANANCWPDAASGAPATGVTEVGLDAAHTFYVDDRDYLLGGGLWIWEESNGAFVGGAPCSDLQVGASCSPIPGDCGFCGGYGGQPPCAADPDTLLF